MERKVNPFAYHKPNPLQVERIEDIRLAFAQCLDTVEQLIVKTPDNGRYISLMKTHIEMSAMWATKAVVFEEA